MLQSLPSKTEEGATEEITCSTDTANPVPTVIWRRDNVRLGDWDDKGLDDVDSSVRQIH